MKKIVKKIISNNGLALLMAGMLLVLMSFHPLKNKLEDLGGISFDYEKSEVTILVVSNGCTNKNDFLFTVKGDKLGIYRKKTDRCKAMPRMVSFTYSLKTAGINENKSYTLINKLITNPNIANLQEETGIKK